MKVCIVSNKDDRAKGFELEDFPTMDHTILHETEVYLSRFAPITWDTYQKIKTIRVILSEPAI